MKHQPRDHRKPYQKHSHEGAEKRCCVYALSYPIGCCITRMRAQDVVILLLEALRDIICVHRKSRECIREHHEKHKVKKNRQRAIQHKEPRRFFNRRPDRYEKIQKRKEIIREGKDAHHIHDRHRSRRVQPDGKIIAVASHLRHENMMNRDVHLRVLHEKRHCCDEKKNHQHPDDKRDECPRRDPLHHPANASFWCLGVWLFAGRLLDERSPGQENSVLQVV